MKTFYKPSLIILIFFSSLSVVNAQILADAGKDKTICLGESVKIGGNPTGIPGSRFQWSNSGSLDSSDVANPFASPKVTTVYTVTVSDINGRSNTDQVTVTVEIPDTVNAGKDTLICKGDSVHLGGNPTAVAGTTYLWKDSTSINDDTVANPLAFPDSTTTYVVTITDKNGCTNTDTIIVTVFEADITQNGSTLSTSIDGASYQWLDCNGGDTAIVDADDQDFLPKVDGNYAVEVTFNGCVDTSDCINVIAVGEIEEKELNIISIFPNPTKDFLFIQSNSLSIQEGNIYNIEGKMIRKITGQIKSIDLSDIENGVYILELIDHQNIYYKRFFKQ